MPSPAKGEEKESFIARCMGDEEANKTFPDAKQRAAFCYRQWADKDKEKRSMDQKWDNIAAFEGLEVREEGGQIHIDGYAAVFDSLSEEFEARFREVIKPGAFKEVLEKESDIVALVDHEPKLPLGRRSKGTLEIREDTRGLRVSITPPDTQDVKDLTARIRRGDYGGMSFRFKVAADGERWTRENGQRIREIRNLARMPEISIVTFPQYRETAVALRSLERFEQSEVEAWAERQRRLLDLAAENA